MRSFEYRSVMTCECGHKWAVHYDQGQGRCSMNKPRCWCTSYKEEPDDSSPNSGAASRPDPVAPMVDMARLAQDALGAKLHNIFPDFYPDRDAGVAALRAELGR